MYTYAHTLSLSLSYLYIFFGQWCPGTQRHHLIICAGSAKETYYLFIQLNQLQMCVCFCLRSFVLSFSVGISDISSGFVFFSFPLSFNEGI